MKYITKLKLAAAHQWCDSEDKSDGFTIQYMQDACKVSHDTVISYFNLPEKELENIRKDLMNFLEFFDSNYGQLED